MALGTVWLACSSNSSGPVSLAPTLIFPQGLLDGVTKLTVTVYDPSGGTLSCNTSNGSVDGLTTEKPLATNDLSTDKCSPGAKFCGDVSIDKTGDMRLFTAQAFVGSNAQPVASGCTAAAPNQDTVQIQIHMLRFIPQSVCNGQPSAKPTQCPDPGASGDPVCDSNCFSLEEYFSKGDGVTTSDSKQKLRPMLVWPSGSGDGARLLGFWGDKSSGSGTEASMRVLADDMKPYTGQGVYISTNSFRVPGVADSQFPPTSYPYPQFNPTAAAINGTYFVAFEDTGSSSTQISLRSLSPVLSPSTVKQVSDTTTSAQALPAMAANSSNKMFIAWENQGSIVGKVADEALTLSAQKTLGPGTSVAVAGTSNGWVAVYQSGSDIMMVNIDASGNPGTPTNVNDGTHTGAQQHPGVAAFGSNVAVVWIDSGAGNGGSVYVQRFNSSGKVAADQAQPIQDPSLGAAQSTPSIAAGASFFVATWVDSGTGHVRARFLDGNGGYLFNAVTGQSGDFQASTLDGATRTLPVAAVGGSGPYVVIAWEDDPKGIWGRRFPLPL